jgi:sugar/nucleoside kinase (ribokinase family)
MEEMIALARRWHLPLAVSDIVGPEDARLPNAAIVATSRSVLHYRHNVHGIEAWMQAVHAVTGALVVVSDGPRPGLALSPEGDWLAFQPPAIQPIDTTGAGDALKAGLILGWLRQWSTVEALRWGVAAASLHCLQHGPCEAPATSSEITALLPSITVEQRRAT